VGYGPIVRIGWQSPTGFVLRAVIASLMVSDTLVAAEGRSSLVQSVALAEVGQRREFWDGRLIPEVTLALGAQHFLARGEASAPNRGVTDQVVVMAATLGGGLGVRVSDEVVVSLGAQVVITLPEPAIFIGESEVGVGRPLGGLGSVTARYLF
jgi:hypothetical protein